MSARARRLFERMPGQARERPIRNGAIALVVAGLALFAGYTGGLPFVGSEDGRLVRAEFAAANEVDARTPVRVAGVDVGHVESVRLADAGRSSIVSMRITADDVTIKRDARADVRWRTLLGGAMYVELDPGSPSAPPDDQRFIERDRTASQVEFDHFNQPFDRPTVEANREILRGYRDALADPAATAQALDALSPALRTVERGVEPLQGELAGDLRRLVAGTATTLDALAVGEDRLGRLVASAATTFGVTAAQRRQLGELVELSPPTMDATVATLRRLDGTLDRLDPLVADLRPGARRMRGSLDALSPALAQTDALLRDARPLLRRLGPTFDRLAGAGRSGVPLFRGLAPTLDRLSDDILPWLAERDPDTGRRTYEMIGPHFAVLASGGGEFDGEGYWLHYPTQGDERSIGNSPCQTFLTDPTAAEKVRCDQLNEVLERALGGPQP